MSRRKVSASAAAVSFAPLSLVPVSFVPVSFAAAGGVEAGGASWARQVLAQWPSSLQSSVTASTLKVTWIRGSRRVFMAAL